jgi:polar amino acid transport system permease protein
VSQAAAVYVELIRNTPILVQIFFLFYGLPQLGIVLSPFTAAWLAVLLWGGAFSTENFRAGFEAVPVRYREAGYALGFGPVRTFASVTLPIGGRIALPSTINTSASVLKNTSLLTAIGFAELTNVARNISAVTFRDSEMLVVVALAYLALVWTLSGAIRLLEARLRIPA